MDEYIRQMQDYLNKNSPKKEENDILKEIEENLNKKEEINDEEEDLDFQQIINNNQNLKKEENQINNKEEIKEKEVNEKKNLDEIPITGNNKLNFNELLEKELSKEQNEGNFNNYANKVEPKF
jgi:hypothetical protein